jgi:hypothetical protein
MQISKLCNAPRFSRMDYAAQGDFVHSSNQNVDWMRGIDA